MNTLQKLVDKQVKEYELNKRKKEAVEKALEVLFDPRIEIILKQHKHTVIHNS